MSFSQQLLVETTKAKEQNSSFIHDNIYYQLITDIKSNQDKYDNYKGPLNAKDLSWKLYSEAFQKPYSECLKDKYWFQDLDECKKLIPGKYASNKETSDYIKLVEIPRNNILSGKEAFIQYNDPFVFGKGPIEPGFMKTWASVILIVIILLLLILNISSIIDINFDYVIFLLSAFLLGWEFTEAKAREAEALNK